MATQQVKLTENELRAMIAEAVKKRVDEDNFMTRWWNRKDIDKYSRLAHQYAQEYQNSGNDDDYQNYEWALRQLKKYDKNKAAEIEDEWYDVMNPQEESQPGEPFDYGLGSHTLQTGENGADDSNETPQSEETPSEEQPSQETPTEETPNQQPQPETPNQQQPQPQPATPAYQRGKGYNLTFNQENEDVFNNYISPAYNSVTNAMKALQNLEQLGEQKYNETSKIWNDYGSSNLSGAQANYKQVCQQINSILPTLQSIKAEMKQILYANGVRQSADYQHYGMEEQKLRKIVSNSIQKILKENLVRKDKKHTAS